MKELKKDSFIVIRPFMVTELNLKGNSLLLYALIHGITINEGAFYGSIEYMQAWCNSSNRSVISCLQELTKAGLITKKKSGNTVFYTANITHESEESSQSSEESSLSCVKKVHSESEESSHNNIIINKFKNNNINSSSTSLKYDDFPEPDDFPTETTTSKKKNRTKKVSAEEKHKQYLSSLPSEIVSLSEKCADKLVSHLIRLQNSRTPAAHKLAWQEDFARFLVAENKSEKEILAIIDSAMTGWWADKIYSADGLIKQYGKLYQQLNSSYKSDYQKNREDAMERGNMNTGNRDYLIF